MNRALPIVAVLLAALVATAYLLGDGGLDGDRIARLVYLGAILTVVAAGVFGSGIGLSQGLRNAAIWLAIVLILAAAYQYRDALGFGGIG